jgi:hypothetical protein
MAAVRHPPVTERKPRVVFWSGKVMRKEGEFVDVSLNQLKRVTVRPKVKRVEGLKKIGRR